MCTAHIAQKQITLDSCTRRPCFESRLRRTQNSLEHVMQWLWFTQTMIDIHVLQLCHVICEAKYSSCTHALFSRITCLDPWAHVPDKFIRETIHSPFIFWLPNWVPHVKYESFSCVGLICWLFFVPDRPTEVKLGIYANSFYSINEQTMVGTGHFC